MKSPFKRILLNDQCKKAFFDKLELFRLSKSPKWSWRKLARHLKIDESHFNKVRKGSLAFSMTYVFPAIMAGVITTKDVRMFNKDAKSKEETAWSLLEILENKAWSSLMDGIREN